MNVYDFDNTIYDGESIVDFYLFVLVRKPKLIRLLPKVFYMLARYKACKITEEKMVLESEKHIKTLFCELDLDTLIPKFWDKNQKKIKKFYLENKKEDDVILSAGAQCLIDEISGRIGVKNAIATEFDPNTGKITRLCFRRNKVNVFKSSFPGERIDEFYTDSMNDAPMFELSKRVFLVKGNKVKEIKNEV